MAEIQTWAADHPRWPELAAVVAQMGQTGWVNFSTDFHLTSHMLVALDEEQIVGFLRYVRQPVGPDSDCAVVMMCGQPLVEAKILAFGVVEDHQRQGIGRALQEAAIKAARCQHCYQIRSHSGGEYTANHRLKLSLGFGIHPVVRGADKKGAYFILPLRNLEEGGKQ